MSVVVMFLSPARVAATHVEMPLGWKLRFLESNDETEIIATCRDADCILSVGSVAGINAHIIANCKMLKFIQCMGAGFNQIDLAAATQRKILVANSPGENARSVAEFTIGSIIALQRRILESDAAIKAGHYTTFRRRVLQEGLQEIDGSRLGLIGIGNIGLQVARIAQLLGASVTYYSQHRRPLDIEKQLGIVHQSLDELLSGSDIVSLHVPLNAQTRGMIGARELNLMPSGSLLVNTSRGSVIDQLALAQVLESGHLGGAAIDTFDPEPPDENHPLLHLSRSAQDRVLLTPHTSGVTFASFRRMLAANVANIERVLKGEPAKNQINSF